jgi:hypothetical protein
MRYLVLLIALASCKIDHRTDQFACESQNQCGDGQTCTDGFCITVGNPNDGPDPDGMPPKDAFACPIQCTSCQLATMTCNVDCGQSPATCLAAINCPAGFNCNILCTRNEGCQNINCSQAESCKIECKGNTTCRNVVCGPGKCDVNCTGGQSCRDIDCGDSCACDVACGNNATCLDITCPGAPLACSGFGLDRCTSEPNGCNTCE